MRAQSLLPIVLTVSGAVLYHASSKSVPRGMHPLAAIVAAYLGAIAMALLAAWRWPAPESFVASLRHFNWAVAGVGLGALLIEVGFILAYRAGWPLSTTSLALNVAAALLLLLGGLAFFGERLTVTRASGIVLCLAGLVLLSREAGSP